ncbi:MAG TPA: anti-sigma factor [Burkholderiales bacterium]|jgi:anti-sigma factor RsiW|nr:anti-sigma factor [Burkholderiales bacterium]
MSVPPVTEAELNAYVDAVLPPARAAEVEAYLAERPDEAARVASYREQAHALRREFDQVLDEPVPERLRPPPPARALRRYAAVLAWIVLGGAIGWQLHAYTSVRQVEAGAWARRAAMAHVTYSPEVRHPVEVGADQEAHLVAWLSKRLGTPLKVPHLGGLGYSLVGGRLLPGDRGPVAQFMYQDGKGLRLTLYVRVNPDASRETAFRFSQEQGISVFYWLDKKLGYALSGEIDKSDLLRVADAVYKQLNP